MIKSTDFNLRNYINWRECSHGVRCVCVHVTDGVEYSTPFSRKIVPGNVTHLHLMRGDEKFSTVHKFESTIRFINIIDNKH